MKGLEEIQALLDRLQIAPDVLQTDEEILLLRIGVYPYQLVRSLQDGLVDLRQQRKCTDTILICEHQPVVTVGRRESLSSSVLTVLKNNNIEIVSVNRGGMATYHGPGQIVIYPVVSLRDRGWGIRFFVESMLSLIADTLNEFSVCARGIMDPAGVWVSAAPRSGTIDFNSEKKIAAVGLRIQNGISNHGFSLNYDCNLEPYSYFTACGLVDAKVTSVANELKALPDKEKFVAALSIAMQRLLSYTKSYQV